MTKLLWDQVDQKFYETGVDRGVLYIPNAFGNYVNGYAWNGLTAITESPSGAEVTPQYADNQKYLNLVSLEEFGGTIEAFTYPDEFGQCDGTAGPQLGVSVGQQNRTTFGICYRSNVGLSEVPDYGYKLHLVYGALAAPSEKARSTVNDSPEAMPFSWEFSTTPIDIPGTNPLTGKPYKKSATITINSTQVSSSALSDLEDFLYGTSGSDPSLPSPAAVFALFAGSVTVATPTQPSYVSETHTITIPTITGVIYTVDGEIVPAGALVITASKIVKAVPAVGYKFPAVIDNDWFYAFA